MRKTFFLFLLTFPFYVVAQSGSIQQSTPLSEALPEIVGMSSKRLARIDAVLEKAVKEQTIPGVVALIAKDGKIVYHKAFGHANSVRSKY